MHDLRILFIHPGLRPSPPTFGLSLLVGMFLGLSCAQEDECVAGYEGCACADERCLTGLSCLSGYCVDPSPASGESDDHVMACKALADDLACGDYDLTSVFQCDSYADLPCSTDDYFDCIRDTFTCTEGVPDVSGLLECNDLITCQ